MRKFVVVAAVALACFAVPAIAREHFQSYEGRDAIQEGQGGTRLKQNGIDYWTSGNPPRRYQILGLLIDKRGMGRIAGDALGSASIAQAVKDKGGDAVIFLGEQDKVQGSVGSGFASGGRGWGSGFGVSATFGDRETAMQVVKYLPDVLPVLSAVPSPLPSPVAK